MNSKNHAALYCILLVSISVGLLSFSAEAQTTGVYCVSKKGGPVRYQVKGRCKKSEKTLTGFGQAGAAGAQGETGPAGVQGTTGANGIPGPIGPTGADGSRSEYWQGSTGLANFQFTSYYAPNEINFTSMASERSHASVLGSNSCDDFEVYFSVDLPPGEGQDISLMLMTTTDPSIPPSTGHTLCTISDLNKNCAAVILDLPVQNEFTYYSVTFSTTSSPTVSKAKWAIRCTSAAVDPPG